MPRAIIYITRGQLTPEFEAKRRVWYRTRHATDVLGVGFWSARGYSCPTVPQNCNVYELPSVDVVSSEAYMAMRKADTFGPTVVNSFSYLSASLYNQDVVTDASGKPIEDVPTIKGPVLSMLRFDCADVEGVKTWFDKKIVAAHRGQPGVTTIRLWQQGSGHPLFPPKEPRWCAAVEWHRKPDNAGATLHAAVEDTSIKLEKTNVDVGVKWYGLVREDIFEPAP
jgi:hypothetical protein